MSSTFEEIDESNFRDAMDERTLPAMYSEDSDSMEKKGGDVSVHPV